ncbi:MAG: hypothetical protein ABRQ39_19550 [Candidatus Eremiobacterota bacterium]
MIKYIGLIMFFIIALYGVSFAQDSEKDIKATAEKYLDNLLAGIKENNYEKYSRDFNGDLKKSLTKDYLTTVKTNMEQNFGNYKSRQYLGLLRKGQRILVLWKAAFDGTKNDVLIQLFLTKKDNKYQITGVLFG